MNRCETCSLEHEANEKEIKWLRDKNEMLIKRIAKAYTVAKRTMGDSGYGLFSREMDLKKEEK